MDKTITDTNNKPLQEGLYVRTDSIFGDHSISSIVYIQDKEGGLYQESLETMPNPLQVSERTTFKPLSQRDKNWLRQRLSPLEQIDQTTITAEAVRARDIAGSYEPGNLFG